MTGESGGPISEEARVLSEYIAGAMARELP
jgi:hypothetical protein